MRYLSIENLQKHQHYKDRRPPWIKLHAEVLDDYEFLCLQDASKAHLMLLWLLASKMDNRIPNDPQFLEEKLGATSPVNVQELIDQGFVDLSEDDSKPLAFRKQSAMPETETEAEAQKQLLPPGGGKKKRSSNGVHPISTGWPVEGAELWSRDVSPMTPAQFGGIMKPVVDAVGWPDAKAGLLCFIEIRKDQPKDLTWYRKDSNRWIRLAKMPVVDPVTHELTEKGRMA